MKGIVLAGGKGTRLSPLTKITSKQLLPIYNKQMIFYPIETLIRAGIRDILVIIAPDYAGQFLNLLGSGKELGVRFTYEIQQEPRGLGEAFLIGENFIGKDNVAMILGDNIFFGHDFSEHIRSFEKGALIFAKKTSEAKRYAVVEFNEQMKVSSIEEKPEQPRSDYASVGLYVYDSRVVDYAKTLKPSKRGQLEIVDLHNKYLQTKELKVEIIDGYWEDAGTFESYYRSNDLARQFALLADNKEQEFRTLKKSTGAQTKTKLELESLEEITDR